MKLRERTRAYSLTMAALNLGVAGFLFYPSWLAASSVLDGLTVVAVLDPLLTLLFVVVTIGWLVDSMRPGALGMCCQESGPGHWHARTRQKGALARKKSPRVNRTRPLVGEATVVRCSTVLLSLVACSSQAFGQTTWRGLVIAPEHRCSPYVSDHYAYPQMVEPGIARELGGIYSPYTGQCFATLWETDIEHMIARSEAHDSGLCSAPLATRRQFASDLLNLTLAAPALNRAQKGAHDAAAWLPAQNRCWFAARVVRVRQKYGLTIDPREAATLDAVLNACTTTRLEAAPCERGLIDQVPPPDFSGPWDIIVSIWRAIAPYLGW